LVRKINQTTDTVDWMQICRGTISDFSGRCAKLSTIAQRIRHLSTGAAIAPAAIAKVRGYVSFARSDLTNANEPQVSVRCAQRSARAIRVSSSLI
jgi:hypothetical protein